MSQTNENLNGALTGIAVAAAAHWTRYDDETQRRLRSVRLDAEEALELVREMQHRGEVVRSRLPSVMDAEVGLALANPQPPAASVLPNTAPLSRPNLTSQMETAVADLTWPPAPGQYDERGLVQQAGELTSMFLALTFEEVRAFIQGLAQSRPPSREAKVQICLAAQALVAQLCEQHATLSQYKAAWARLFETEVTPLPRAVPRFALHLDSNQRPQITGPFGTNVQYVAFLNSLSSSLSPYANPNTDAAMRLRVTAATTGDIAEGTALCVVRFGTEFKYRGGDGVLVPFQPVVQVHSRKHAVYADNITSMGFALFANSPIAAGRTLDVFISTCTGVTNES